jgi:hypothetical protein
MKAGTTAERRGGKHYHRPPRKGKLDCAQNWDLWISQRAPLFIMVHDQKVVYSC